jgi:hypothetical protein
MVWNLCVGEKYTKDGEERMKWNSIGVMFESKDKKYMKLYHMPGTLISVFEPKPKEGQGEAF